MKLITLLENTAAEPGLKEAHGLSLYLETPRHKLLFDMGPNGDFLENAGTLGVDLGAVDLAILSHGHYDHGGGLETFLRCNEQAPVYLRENAFGDYYSMAGKEHYIGLDPALRRYEERFHYTGELCRIDEELTLFSAVPDEMNALRASGKLKEKREGGFIQDEFSHEQDLLIEAQGKSVLVAGCAHRGIVNIIKAATKRLGRRPDVVIGGFHFFQLEEGDREGDALIDAVGQKLLEGDTIYYSGHCTGAYAYSRLQGILGPRLRPLQGGVRAEL